MSGMGIWETDTDPFSILASGTEAHKDKGESYTPTSQHMVFESPTTLVQYAVEVAMSTPKTKVFHNLFNAEDLVAWNEFQARKDVVILKITDPPAPQRSATVQLPRCVDYKDIVPIVFNILLVVYAVRGNWDPAYFVSRMLPSQSADLLSTMLHKFSEGKGVGLAIFCKGLDKTVPATWTDAWLEDYIKTMFPLEGKDAGIIDKTCDGGKNAKKKS